RHQKDVELILRVLSLYTRFDLYEKPMKEFLNKRMSTDKNGTSPEVNAFISQFPSLCETIVSRLGEKPFHLRGRLNVSALDAVMCTILRSIGSIPENLAERYERLKADED